MAIERRECTSHGATPSESKVVDVVVISVFKACVCETLFDLDFGLTLDKDPPSAGRGMSASSSDASSDSRRRLDGGAVNSSNSGESPLSLDVTGGAIREGAMIRRTMSL
jgi:hypothetical protein